MSEEKKEPVQQRKPKKNWFRQRSSTINRVLPAPYKLGKRIKK